MPLLPPHFLQPIQPLSLAVMNSIKPKGCAFTWKKGKTHSRRWEKRVHNLKCSVCPSFNVKIANKKIANPKSSISHLFCQQSHFFCVRVCAPPFSHTEREKTQSVRSHIKQEQKRGVSRSLLQEKCASGSECAEWMNAGHDLSGPESHSPPVLLSPECCGLYVKQTQPFHSAAPIAPLCGG